MNEATRVETIEKPTVNAQVWPDQYEWLKAKAEAGRRPRSLSDVLREVIDDAMHANETVAKAN